jgi:hypothetical protein
MRAKLIRLSLCLAMLTWLQSVNGRAEPLQCGLEQDSCDDQHPCCSNFACAKYDPQFGYTCTCAGVDESCAGGIPCCLNLGCQANGLCQGQPETAR